MNFKGKDFLTIHDFTSDEIHYILEYTTQLKKQQKQGQEHHILKGKSLGMVFSKSSTRTRVSFEVGMYQLGGMALFLSANDLQIGRGEPIKDTARVMSRYVDGIMIRTFSHAEVEEIAYYADIPIINGLTDLLHPCQAMADIFTVLEHKGTLKGLKMTYIGDGNNVAHSLMHVCAKVGMDITVATPVGYEPDKKMVAQAFADAELTGSKIQVINDPLAAAEGADVLYTDVWASMGQEAEQMARKRAFADFQINSNTMAIANKDAIVMHCLPAHRGEEITNEVIEGPQSVVFDEAENRLHVQKAIMALVMA